ncbi:killer suppression protein [Gordonia sputi]
MILSFLTRDLRTVCEEQSAAIDRYGIELADLLRARVADLCSASTIDDLPVGNPRVCEQTLIVDLGTIGVMRWVPSGKSAKPGEDGVLDWAKVDRLELIAIDRSDR